MESDISSIPIIALEAGSKNFTNESPIKVLPELFKITDGYLLLSLSTKKSFCEKDLEATAIISFEFKLFINFIISKNGIHPEIILNIS